MDFTHAQGYYYYPVVIGWTWNKWYSFNSIFINMQAIGVQAVSPKTSFQSISPLLTTHLRNSKYFKKCMNMAMLYVQNIVKSNSS